MADITFIQQLKITTKMKLFATFALFASSTATFAGNSVEVMCTSCLSEPSDACWGACYSLASRSGTTVHDAIVVPQVRKVRFQVTTSIFSVQAAFLSPLMPAGELVTPSEAHSPMKTLVQCAAAASPSLLTLAGEPVRDPPLPNLRSTRTSSK